MRSHEHQFRRYAGEFGFDVEELQADVGESVQFRRATGPARRPPGRPRSGPPPALSECRMWRLVTFGPLTPSSGLAPL